jgi:hypothetical protein
LIGIAVTVEAVAETLLLGFILYAGIEQWLGELALALRRDLPTRSNQTRVHTEGQRQAQAAGHLTLRDRVCMKEGAIGVTAISARTSSSSAHLRSMVP